jgi:hypothetical protein
MLPSLSRFAGWGPCGALNTAGETEFYFVATVILLAVLGISSLILLVANSRFVWSFDANSRPRPMFLALHLAAIFLRAFVILISLHIVFDYLFLDGNLNELVEDGIPCDPITTDVLIQAVAVTALGLFMSYRQYRRYVKKRAAGK